MLELLHEGECAGVCVCVNHCKMHNGSTKIVHGGDSG